VNGLVFGSYVAISNSELFMVVLQNGVEDRLFLEAGIDDEQQKLEHSHAALCPLPAVLEALCLIYLKCSECQCSTSFRFLQ
jgi:hypothetical protein